MQADDALVVHPGTERQDRAGPGLGDRDLVAREDRHPAPGRHRPPLHLDTLRVDPAAVALAADGRDGPRMREEVLRLPPPAEQLVEVVGGGGAGAGVDALFEVGVVQQPEVAVVDHFVFLAFPQGFDGEAELLFDLVHRLVGVNFDAVEVHGQHGRFQSAAQGRAAADRSGYYSDRARQQAD